MQLWLNGSFTAESGWAPVAGAAADSGDGRILDAEFLRRGLEEGSCLEVSLAQVSA